MTEKIFGATNDHLRLLQSLQFLPHDATRVEELRKLKYGPKRLEILRSGIEVSELIHAIGAAPDYLTHNLIASKFNPNYSTNIITYGEEHERNSKDAFLNYAKQLTGQRVKGYEPGIFSIQGAPFIFAAPPFIQNFPTTTLVYYFKVHKPPDVLPQHVRVQVVAALALTESPIFESKGLTPTAQVYFCPPEGDGVIFNVEFGAEERGDWEMIMAKAVPFFLENMLPYLARSIAIAQLPPTSPAVASPLPARGVNVDVDPPALDQTPSVAVGKKVRDRKRPNRIGTVVEIEADAEVKKALVHLQDEAEKKRKKKYDAKNLEVIPILGSFDLPDATGQTVQVVGGEHSTKLGVVRRWNLEFSYITLVEHQNSGAATDIEPLKMATKSLKLIGSGREVTVPAKKEVAVFALESLANDMPAYLKQRNIRLISNTSLERFIEEVREKREEKIASTRN